jgi:antitoxin (DNA-binding transcriptional repressor) of toxin-antitoxin stability system
MTLDGNRRLRALLLARAFGLIIEPASLFLMQVQSRSSHFQTSNIMHKVDVNEAGKLLHELVEEAARGGDVVITRSDGVAFKLVLAPDVEPRPHFGSAKDEVWMSDDFEEPLDDFHDYMPS